VRLEQFALAGEEVLDDGAEGEGRQEIERADEQHGADEQEGEGRPFTGKVPALGGEACLPASDPASAMMGTIMRKRPMSMARPSVVLYQGVLAVRPAKALPLLPVAEL
jgi:hypothetical protein